MFGAALTSVGLSGLFLGVAYAVTDIPPNLNSYATQQDNVYFWSDGTPSPAPAGCGGRPCR